MDYDEIGVLFVGVFLFVVVFGVAGLILIGNMAVPN